MLKIELWDGDVTKLEEMGFDSSLQELFNERPWLVKEDDIIIGHFSSERLAEEFIDLNYIKVEIGVNIID